ncbi:hypothetical protein EG68_01798 [Paragonimus skrjabini miyazakii]|uniref:Palmitoyltransferase n=1 Tax=Paragonimus skrjabini miyazakii TaxID=59628 RepID=A0A8S9Z5K0_9TREM|nr:hypothetical protein EG68_01798 [Paragonimus skrjabini miyazakii]
MLYLTWFILVLYFCLIPRRVFIWNACVHAAENPCNPSVERLWFVTHIVCSHWFLLLVLFHYLSAIWRHPGAVPTVLSPEVAPIVSMCLRCCYPRPPRAHHCSICEGCILRMDHHCPWIANCVGLRTHRHFYLSVLFMSIGGLYMITVGRWDYEAHLDEILPTLKPETRVAEEWQLSDPIRPVWKHTTNFFTSYLAHRLSFVCFKIGIIAIPMVAVLWLWQTYLITRGETNIEYYMNKRFTRQMLHRGLIYRNPYDFGAYVNWIQFLGLFNPNENKHRMPLLLLIWRFLTRVLLPLPTTSDENGLNYQLNAPTIESVIESLSLPTDS